MKRRWSSWLLVLVLGVGVSAGSASPAAGKWTGHGWGVADGLPEASVRDLAFGPDGYLWLVTPRHLCRFDGVRFADALPQASTNSTIPRAPFEGLHFDRSGRLWVFGQEGAWYFSKGAWTVAVPGAAQAQGGAVRRLSEGPDGRIWLLDERVLRVWNEGALEAFPLPATQSGRTKLYDVAVDDDGGVWLAAADRVLEFRGREFHPVALPDLPIIDVFSNIYRIKYSKVSGRVWTANPFSMFLRENGAWRAGTLPQWGQEFLRLEGLLEVTRDHLWIGSKQGIARCEMGLWSPARSGTTRSAGGCNALVADAHGNIWAGADDGLIRFSPCSITESRIPAKWVSKRVESITVINDDVWAVMADPGMADSVVLSREASKDRDFHILQLDADWNLKIFSAVLVDSQKAAWFGTRGRGLLRNYRGKWDATLYWGAPRADDKGLVINALLESSAGHIWVGTQDGLMECLDPHGEMRMRPLGPPASVKTLYEDRDGSLWCGYEDEGLLRVGTNGTLSAYRQSDGLPGPGVMALCRDADGVLWLGGRDGLARWEGGGLQTLFGAAQGLPAGPVVQIVADEAGGLWLGTSSGIVRLDRGELARAAAGEEVPLTIRLLGRDDGLPGEECTGGLLLKGWQPFRTNLWFGTAAGLTNVKPGLLPPSGKAPRVIVESLSVDGHLRFNQEPLAGLTRAFPAAVRLAPDSRRIEIGFSASDCARPERVRFRYRLDEGAWSPLTAQRTAVFEWLAPGHHRFAVAGIGADGGGSGECAVLDLDVEPWFWQTGWFMAGVGLLGLTVTAAGMRGWQRRRYRRRMAALEKQQALQEERARIARDLHDEIGAKLSRLSFQGALLQKACGAGEGALHTRTGEMVETAAKTLSAFDDIVWATNPRHDSLRSLVDRICRHVEEYFAGADIACHFCVDRMLPDWPLEPQNRNELYLAVKEALTNILKHAGATAVEVAVAVDGRRLEIVVSDNGRGFELGGDTPAPSGDAHGNGLRNMRERMAAMGGACVIESVPGRGSKVIFTWEAR